jgi:hypothetical protein
MVNIDKESLERALTNPQTQPVETPTQPTGQPQQPQMTPEEEIGFHKGSLNTLAAERNELAKMVGNVEAIMQAHLKRLEELGVKLETQGQQ